jgi:pimeloyl-ACP methyl ester carboxylesterase
MTLSAKRDADQYFTTGNARLRYRDTGRGPPMLMVHGWTLDLEMWEPQAAALCDAFRVVRFDRRGFGLSSGCPSVALDPADIGSLCEHLAMDRVALLGMSQGVRAVLGFALTAPARISCLIVDGPPDYSRKAVSADDDVPLNRYRALVRSHGIAAFRREWSAHPLLSLTTSDPRMREILDGMIGRYPGNDLAQLGVYDEVPTGRAPIGSVDLPTLVITGDRDLPSRTRAADDLARQLPGAVRSIIPAAGHLPNLDNPEVYNAVVRTFLERNAAATRRA